MVFRLSDRLRHFILLSVLALLGIGSGILWLSRQPCPTPKRPRGVPAEAVWVGGCEGGNWVGIDAASAGRYQVAIYHSSYGDKIKEGWFALSSQCLSRDIPPGRLLGNLNGYDGASLELTGDRFGDRCRLEPVTP